MIDFKELAYKYKDEAIKTLQELIRCESVLTKYNPNSEAPFGEGCKDALDYILNKGRSFGLSAKNVANYAGHIEYGNNNGELLGILAHLDVVPVTRSEWSYDPFDLTIKDGKMYGRGTTDDKGPLVASLFALKLLKDNQIKLNKKVRLIMGCDEESGSRCLERYFKEEEMPKLGFSPDAEFPVIYGEKAHANYYLYLKDDLNIIKSFNSGTRFNIVPAKAIMQLNIDLKDKYLAYLKEKNYKGEVVGDTYYAYGVSSHAMIPEKGLNAAFILLEFLALNTDLPLAKYAYKYLTFDPFAKKLKANISDLDMGNLTMNCGVFSYENNVLKIGLDFRIPKDNYTKTLDSLFKESLLPYNFTFEKLGETSIHYVKKDSFLVRKLTESYAEMTGDYVSKPFTIGGGTYAKFIKECVAFGPQRPNTPDLCHIADEYMLLDDFILNIAIYAKAIYELGK